MHSKTYRVVLDLMGVLVISVVTLLAQDSTSQPMPKPNPGSTEGEVRASYILGPDDQISINALEIDEISRGMYRIDGSGNVTVPMLGRVHAAGFTVEQFEAQLVSKLKAYVQDPQLSVSVTDYRSQAVSVLGAVNTPGVQLLQGRKTLAEVLSQAGGIKPEAGYSVRITRKIERGPIPLPGVAPDPTGKFNIAQVNLNDILTGKKPELNILVQPEDVISVPRGELIYVIGEVKKAGGFVLSDQGTVSILSALAMAEGLGPLAAPKSARILRDVNSSNRQEIPINLKNIMSGKTKDVALQSNDILFIPKNDTRALLGKIADVTVGIGSRMVIYRY